MWFHCFMWISFLLVVKVTCDLRGNCNIEGVSEDDWKTAYTNSPIVPNSIYSLIKEFKIENVKDVTIREGFNKYIKTQIEDKVLRFYLDEFTNFENSKNSELSFRLNFQCETGTGDLFFKQPLMLINTTEGAFHNQPTIVVKKTTITDSAKNVFTTDYSTMPVFESPYYVAYYNSNTVLHTILLDTLIKLKEESIGIIPSLEGDMASYFEVKLKSHKFVITIKKNLPKEVLDKDPIILLTLNAFLYRGIEPGKTVIAIYLHNRLPPASLEFQKDNYYYKIPQHYNGHLAIITATATPEENIIYSLEHVEGEEHLENKLIIGKNDGKLKILNELNFGTYKFLVRGYTSISSATTNVAIFVQDQLNVPSTPSLNKRSSIFKDVKDGILVAGYPEKTLLQQIRLPYLTKIYGSDVDSRFNAAIEYTIDKENYVIHPMTGVIYPVKSVLKDENITVTVTNRNGKTNGSSKNLVIWVKLLHLKNLIVLKTENVLLEDVEENLQKISQNSDVTLKSLTALIVPSEGKESNFSMKQYNFTTIIVGYGISSAREILTVQEITRKLGSLAKGYTLEEMRLTKESQECEENNITEYIIAVSVLASLLVIFMISAAILFYVKLFKNRKSDEEAEERAYNNNSIESSEADQSRTRNVVFESSLDEDYDDDVSEKSNTMANTRRPTGFIFSPPPDDDDDSDSIESNEVAKRRSTGFVFRPPPPEDDDDDGEDLGKSNNAVVPRPFGFVLNTPPADTDHSEEREIRLANVNAELNKSAGKRFIGFPNASESKDKAVKKPGLYKKNSLQFSNIPVDKNANYDHETSSRF